MFFIVIENRKSGEDGIGKQEVIEVLDISKILFYDIK